MKDSLSSASPLLTTVQAAEQARRDVAVSPLVVFWNSMIGQKVVMAITGVVLVLFVTMHMIGNLKILTGPEEINAYAVFL